MNRRNFIQQSTMAGAGVLCAHQGHSEDFLNFTTFIRQHKADSTDEEFWKLMALQFHKPSDFVQLEYGYFSPVPAYTLNHFIQKTRDVNTRTSYFMRKEQDEERNRMVQLLAEFSDAPADCLTLTRNTTESLDTIIHGYPWQKGDEVVCTHQDYGSMLEALGQEEKRHEIVKVQISLPLNPANDDEVVALYRNAITPKTKLVLLTHMINLNGHLLPAKKIIEACHAQGVEVMVDAAHSFAHTHFSIRDLQPDYLGASLHKWLCCPLGLGFMYIKKEHISKIWPLFGDMGYSKTDIRKFWHQGTQPPATWLALAQAIEFHQSIGTERKLARLRYLKSYWKNKVASIRGVISQSPQDPLRGGAIANIGYTGLTPSQLSEKLFKEHKIFTVAIDTKDVKGVRVTPHICTTTDELDLLVNAINLLSK